MLEQILSYFLPSAADATHRVAARSAAIALGVIVGATVLAFGTDTIAIINGLIGDAANDANLDISLTTTTISVALLLIFAAFLYGSYASVRLLIAVWSRSYCHWVWTRIGTQFSLIILGRLPGQIAPSTAFTQIKRTSFGIETHDLLGAIEAFFIDLSSSSQHRDGPSNSHSLNEIFREQARREVKKRNEVAKRITDLNTSTTRPRSYWLQLVDYCLFLFQVEGGLAGLRREELKKEQAKLDKSGGYYKTAVERDKERMLELTRQLSKELARLDFYLRSLRVAANKHLDEKSSANDEAPIERLMLRWQGADDCWQQLTELMKIVRAPDTPVEATKYFVRFLKENNKPEDYITQIASLCDDVRRGILDSPFIPSSVQDEAAKAGKEIDRDLQSRLGSTLVSTSFGLGTSRLDDNAIDYYINARHKTWTKNYYHIPGNPEFEADATRIPPALLRQNEIWRENLLREVVALNFATLLFIVLAAAGPYVFRSSNNAVLALWPVLAATFGTRAWVHYRRACRAGIRLAALESHLWQLALSMTRAPKPLLVTRKIRSDLQVFYSATRVWVIFFLVSYFCAFAIRDGLPICMKAQKGSALRTYQYLVVKHEVSGPFKITTENIDNIVEWRRERRSNPPAVRSKNALIGTVIVGRCSAGKRIETLVSWSERRRMRNETARRGMLVNQDGTKCTPIIDYPEVNDPALGTEGPVATPTSLIVGAASVALKVRVQAQPPLVAGEDGMTLEMSAPRIKLVGPTDPAELTVKVLEAKCPATGVADGDAAECPSASSAQGRAPGAQTVDLTALLQDNIWLPRRGAKSISLWFKINCPQKDSATREAANGKTCAAADNPMNDGLNETLHSSVDKILEFVRRNPKARIVVVGYTDDPGSPGYNELLSKERVAFVQDLLAAHKDIKNKIQPLWVGSDFPWIKQDSPPEVQSLNRRVDLFAFVP